MLALAAPTAVHRSAGILHPPGEKTLACRDAWLCVSHGWRVELVPEYLAFYGRAATQYEKGQCFNSGSSAHASWGLPSGYRRIS
jgi:hypothetical protein